MEDMLEMTKEEFEKNKEIYLNIAELKEVPKILLNPNLLEIINKEFDKFIVDENQTRKAIFVCGCGAFVSNLSATFNILINGESSAGKSWITKNVLLIFPKTVFKAKGNASTYRTKISANALTYWHNPKVDPDWTWNGKILYLEDIGNNILNSDVFKVMISEGSTATIVGRSKTRDSEMPTTYDIEINGKPITFVTTASGIPIDEIKNRFLLIDVDESANQTEKIMQRQIEIATNGFEERFDKEIVESLSYLKRVKVIIPEWIKGIVKFIPRKDVLRWRREFPRFLEIIKCSASLHQFQRVQKEECILANEQDYEIARQVIGKISTSSGVEGLTHRERKSLQYIKDFFKEFGKGCTRSKIYAFKPSYSDRQWGDILEKLSEKGLLSVQIEIDTDTGRKAAHFYPIEFKNMVLPDFINLNENHENPMLKINFSPKNEISIGNDGKGSDGSNGSNGDTYVTAFREKGLPLEIEVQDMVHLDKGISSITSTPNSEKKIFAITSTTILAQKDGEIFNLTLESGNKYPISYFGDAADKILDILEKEGKIRWI